MLRKELEGSPQYKFIKTQDESLLKKIDSDYLSFWIDEEGTYDVFSLAGSTDDAVFNILDILNKNKRIDLLELFGDAAIRHFADKADILNTRKAILFCLKNNAVIPSFRYISYPIVSVCIFNENNKDRKYTDAYDFSSRLLADCLLYVSSHKTEYNNRATTVFLNNHNRIIFELGRNCKTDVSWILSELTKRFPDSLKRNSRNKSNVVEKDWRDTLQNNNQLRRHLYSVLYLSSYYSDMTEDDFELIADAFNNAYKRKSKDAIEALRMMKDSCERKHIDYLKFTDYLSKPLGLLALQLELE